MTSKEALEKLKWALYKLADHTATKESELLETYGLVEPLKVIEQLAEQAQKQEKLLELYKELITVKDDLFDCCEIVDDEYYDIRKTEKDLENQIKELEK